MKTWLFGCIALFFAFQSSWLLPRASAQCVGCASGTRVNDQYQPDPYGRWYYIVNGQWSGGSWVGSNSQVTSGTWNFTHVATTGRMPFS
jgi:hypothetical protein